MRCNRRCVGLVEFRHVILLAAALAAVFLGGVQAVAQEARQQLQVRGSQEPQGFGRIEFVFDEETPVRAQSRNGVLVVHFGDAVRVTGERLAQQMPSYVSVVRADPDGTGMRLALTQNFRANVLEAGERVFIDLLPERWSGLNPGLPPEVVADLARRARAAEALFASERARRAQPEIRPMPVRVAELPTLTRLIFEPPEFAPITERASEEGIELRFDEPFRLAPERPLGSLPGIRAAEEEQVEGALFVRLLLEEGYALRGFHEERNYVVDIEPLEPISPFGLAEVADAGSADPTREQPSSEQASPEQAQSPRADPAPAPPQRAASDPEPARPEASGDLVREAAAPAPVLARAAQPLAEAVAVAEVDAGGLSIRFTFGNDVPAAAFERADVINAVFHTRTPLAVAPFPEQAQAYASLLGVVREGDFVNVRLQLAQANLARIAPEPGGWLLTIGDNARAAPAPLAPTRDLDDAGRSILSIPLDAVSGVFWMDAPDTGERIAVATRAGDPHHVPRLHRFVEVDVLPSLQGLAIAARADDVLVRPELDHVAIGRAAGLTLSELGPSAPVSRNPLPADPLISRERWDGMRQGRVRDGERQRAAAVLEAPPSARMAARVALAEYLLANDLAPEANAVLTFIQNEDAQAIENPRFALLRGVVKAQMGRFADARAFFAGPLLQEDPEVQLWRGHVDALEGRRQAALAAFRRGRMLLETYPDDLQARMRMAAIDSALELREYGLAERELAHLALLRPGSAPRDEVDLLGARLDMAMGRPEFAMETYARLAEDGERPVSSEARLRWIEGALDAGELDAEEAIAMLETLAVSWRGGDVEIGAIGRLGRLYAQQGRWREAFLASRNANLYFPDHPVTQALHEETAELFTELFLGGLGDTLSRIDTVALFFDFRDFLPIGRRGDEIVRRLSDRLVELDLMDQAAELLRHQIDNRIQGAARSTVAARLATIYLMESNPVEALQVLRETRLPELPAAIMRARMLLEARALSDLSRTDLALEVLADETGPEVERLRADIYWTGRRWREAGEAHEQLLGTRWLDGDDLTERERTDVLRAAIAYTLGEEVLSLDRLSSKFVAQMADSEDARVFALVTTPGVASTDAFREIARRVTSADTLADFLEAYRARYPDAAVSARPPRGAAFERAPAAVSEGADASLTEALSTPAAPRG